MTSSRTSDTALRLVLVPGFWLGAWAWEHVGERLTAAGHQPHAVTLPGLDSAATDRSRTRLRDHVDAVVAAVEDASDGQRVVLVGHSGAGPVVYAAASRVPDRLQHLVFVDSGPLPAGSALRPDLAADVHELPLPPWDELRAEGSSTDGLDDGLLDDFRARAVPHPAGPARDAVELAGGRPVGVPVTVVCCSMPAQTVQELVAQGHPFFGELASLRVRYVDLPTGHWPMLSRPEDLADVLADVPAAVG